MAAATGTTVIKQQSDTKVLIFAGTTQQICTCPQTPCIVEGPELVTPLLLLLLQTQGSFALHTRLESIGVQETTTKQQRHN